MNYNREKNNLIIKYRANLLKGKGAKPLGLRGMPMTARLPFVLMSYVATGDINLRFYFVFRDFQRINDCIFKYFIFMFA